MTRNFFGYTLEPWAERTLVIIALVVMAFYTWAKRAEKAHKESPERVALLRLAEGLGTAERTGDRAGALALMEPATGLLVRLDEAAAKQPTKRYCLVAARHLQQGTLDVEGGSPWYSRRHFEEAMKACD